MLGFIAVVAVFRLLSGPNSRRRWTGELTWPNSGSSLGQWGVVEPNTGHDLRSGSSLREIFFLKHLGLLPFSTCFVGVTEPLGYPCMVDFWA